MSYGRGTRIVKIAKAGEMPKPDPVEIDNCLVSANAQVVCGRERMDVVNFGAGLYGGTGVRLSAR